MSRGVDEGQRHRAHLQRVARLHLHEVRAEALQELALRPVHVDLRGVLGEQLGDARNVVTEQVAAHVILVSVGDQHSGEPHVVGGHEVRDAVDLPRRVDHHALAARLVADEIHEVLHRAQLDLLQVEARRHQYPGTQTGWKYPLLTSCGW